MPSRSDSSGRRRARFVALTLTVGVAVAPLAATSFAPGAVAAPTDPSTAESAPSPEHIEMVAEQYNLARLKVTRAQALIVATRRRIQLAETRIATVQDRVRGRAAALYRHSNSGAPLPLANTGDYLEQARHTRYLEAAEVPDRELATQLDTELGRLRIEEEDQRAARMMLDRDLDRAARLKRTLDRLAKEAAARRVVPVGDGAGPIATAPPPVAGAPAPDGGGTTTTTRPGSPPTTPTTTPPTNPPPTGGGSGPAVHPGAATAIAFARAQLGKPYVFAAAGPDSYDCSGLTMAAWAAAGVRMAHYSGSQAGSFPHVTWSQLQPGDIVVFYPDLHHVGLYIGGGQMIHAPQTGDVVKIAPAWRTTFQFGVRPG